MIGFYLDDSGDFDLEDIVKTDIMYGLFKEDGKKFKYQPKNQKRNKNYLESI